MPPRHLRRSPSRRRSSSHGATIGCVLAALALVAAMGVTVANQNEESDERTWRAASASPPAIVKPAPPTPAYVAPPKPPHPLDAPTRAVKDVAKRMSSIRDLERGPIFEQARVQALAELSDARDVLGAYLDRHPREDRANRLWDRLLALYVALKKI